MCLLSTDLALWQRRNPTDCQVDGNMNDADDPAGSGVAAAVVDEPEDDGEHHAAQVAAAAGAPGQDAVGGGMDVRHEGEIGTVACLYEEGGHGDEANHGADVAAIGF